MRPLEDLRIIAVEQYGAGPFGSVHLADLGAEVIKIEDPRAGGDVGRYVPPYAEDEDSLFFETFNRNKRSISLDLAPPPGAASSRNSSRSPTSSTPTCAATCRRSCASGTTTSSTSTRASCACSLTGFGMTGPRKQEPGYDYVLQGLAGWMELTGEPDGPPTKSGLSLVDYSGGFVAAISLLAGVHAARRDGVGMDCDVSLYDTAVSMLTYPATWHLNAGFQPVRTHHSAHPSLVPFQAFEAKDGWMVVGCAKEKFWARLCQIVGHPEWAEAGSPYATFAGRREHSSDLVPRLEAIFRQKTVDDWLTRLYAGSIPCGPINDVGAALADEHTAARNLVVTTDHPRYGEVRQLASPVRVGDETPTYRRAPQRNEDLDSSPRRSWAWTRSRWWRCGRPARSAMPSRHTAEHPDTPTASTPQPRHDDRRGACRVGHGPRRSAGRASGPQRCGTCSTGSERRWSAALPRRGSRRAAADTGRRVARGSAGRRRRRSSGRGAGSVRRPPRSPTALSCTHWTSTTPTPAASCTPQPWCCRPLSPSASRSARRPGRARGRRRRLRDRVPGRRRRVARLPRPRAARHDGGRRVLLGDRRVPAARPRRRADGRRARHRR